MDHAAVRAHRALTINRVVGRVGFHPIHHRSAAGLGLVRPKRDDRFQVVRHRGILSGVHRSRRAAVHPRHVAFGEGAGVVVQVPVERLGQQHALCCRQADPVDVVDDEQQAGDLLAARLDAELGRLLDAVHRVAAAVGEADRLGAAGARLDKLRREVGCAGERMRRLTQHLAAGRLDEAGGVIRQGVAEGIVGGDEEPGVAALLDDAFHYGVRH